MLSIFYSWSTTADTFSGLQRKIGYVFTKGTTLAEAEKAIANSNRPGNDGFVYIVAGKLVHASMVQVISVDGCVHRHRNCPCSRPSSQCRDEPHLKVFNKREHEKESP
jgi:hypothetical protein